MDRAGTRRTVAFGIVGSKLDQAPRGRRWDWWRPSVALCLQDDLVVDRYELFHMEESAGLANHLRQDLAEASPETEVVLHPIRFEDAWDFSEVFEQLFAFVNAYAFDEEREDYLVHMSTGTHVWQICLFLLTESRRLPGRLVQTSPAGGGRDKATGRVNVIDLDVERYARLAERFDAERQEELSVLKAGIDTRDPAFNALIERMEEVAVGSREPILITGPTGVGKTRLARRVHALRARRHLVRGELVEVNCATLRGDGAMSALFGHVRGAYTGAQERREGFLRRADGGMLFLDEIGELGLDEQTMLLRALEEKRFLPLGADQTVESDFQLICGTNRDLSGDVVAGRFREDLLARIDLWHFELPPLLERRADLEPNLDFELERFARSAGRRVRMGRDARRRFLRFAESDVATWAANFRDLRAAVTRMGTLARGGVIRTEDVAAEERRLLQSWKRIQRAGGADDAGRRDLLDEVLGPDRASELDPFDAVQLHYVIETCRRARTLSDAGRQLFARSLAKRKSKNDADRLSKYLARHDLRFEELRPVAD